MSQVADRASRSLAGIEPLRNGDRLDRTEFERRFNATPGLKKAELIEGIVYMPPPVSFSGHASPHVDVVTLLGFYRAATPGVRAGDNGSVRLGMENMPQPDVFLFIDSNAGGQAQVDAEGYLAGAPELVVEIAFTSVSYDLHQKLEVYRRHGVREYLVWRTSDQLLDYFILRDGDYARLSPGTDGILRSEVFPGLWIDAASLLGGDLATALQKLQQGLASPAHQAFVDFLKHSAGSTQS